MRKVIVFEMFWIPTVLMYVRCLLHYYSMGDIQKGFVSHRLIKFGSDKQIISELRQGPRRGLGSFDNVYGVRYKSIRLHSRPLRYRSRQLMV